MGKGKEIANAYIALGADTKGIKKGVKQANKEVKGLGSQVSKLGPMVAAAFSVAAIAGFTKEMVGTAIALEAIDKKATIVFGSFKSEVEDTAKVVATSMGLTESQFINASAAIADLLIPMRFSRKEASKMSTDLVQLSGALSEWSAGKFDAKETSDILAKAMLGEREQLKSLGISIMEADVQARLLEKGQKKLTGTALQQAKAQATLELIYEKSTDAQTAFAEGGDSLTRQSAELKANIGTLKEEFAKGLTPAINAAVSALLDFTEAAKAVVEMGGEIVQADNLKWWEKLGALVNGGAMAASAYAIAQGSLAKQTEIAEKKIAEENQAIKEQIELARQVSAELNKQKAVMNSLTVSQTQMAENRDLLGATTDEWKNKEMALTGTLMDTSESLAANAEIANSQYIPMFETLDELLWATTMDWGMMGNAAVMAGDNMVDAAINGGAGLLDMARAAASAAKKTISAYIAEGVAAQVKGAMASLPPPFGLVLAGVAGAAAASLFNSIIPSFALGGGASSPMMAMIGDHRGASRYNPEAVLSVDQIQKMVGTSQGALTTYIEGDKIAIAYESWKRNEGGIK